MFSIILILIKRYEENIIIVIRKNVPVKSYGVKYVFVNVCKPGPKVKPIGKRFTPLANRITEQAMRARANKNTFKAIFSKTIREGERQF